MPHCARVLTRDDHSCLARVLSPTVSISRLLFVSLVRSRFHRAIDSQRMTKDIEVQERMDLVSFGGEVHR